ncbi:MAG TPA: hypothetical protein VHJ20_15710 [Polyangia bacterium]|nr:hypothetical protein [Polyangia bacterium]
MPPEERSEGDRELDAAPPFATWPRIYALLVVALAAQIVVYAALTAALR